MAGIVDVDKLLEVCCKFEEKLKPEVNWAGNFRLVSCEIRNKLNTDFRVQQAYEKAWQTPVELLEKSVISAVTYPSEVEDNGSVSIGWHGPSMVNEYYL